MALAISYTIEIGTPYSAVDFTGRTLGFSVRQAAPMSDLSPSSAVLTLQNYDGELTPGGTGTYASTDWFAQAIFISATIQGTNTLTAEVFHGFITEFAVADDGTQSVVNIRCDDACMFLGSSAPDKGFVGDTDYEDAIRNTIAIVSGLGELPRLGGTNFTQYHQQAAMGFNTAHTVDASNSTSGTVADQLRTAVLPSYPSAMWMALIRDNASTTVFCEHYDLGSTLTRPTGGTFYETRRQLELNDEKATGTRSEIKFHTLERGFNNVELVNRVAVTTTATGNTSTATDSTSSDAYGQKALTLRAAINETDALAADTANNLLNRRSTSRYVCQRVRTSTALMQTASNDADYTALYIFDVRTCFWNTAMLTFTPTGGNEIEELSVIAGRTIQATPANTIITLDLLPAQDYQSFVLDSDTLGVLDTNRLG